MQSQSSTVDYSYGPKAHGAELYINNIEGFGRKPNEFMAIDCETDEKDNFVGLAVCYRPDRVYYFTNLDQIGPEIRNCPLIGHNLKGDAKWLSKWAIPVFPKDLAHDTMLMSYVMNTTKESHGLKDLGKEFLGWEWPSYHDVVGKGQKKETLDKKPVEEVANYCGMDVLATYKLYHALSQRMTPPQLKFYTEQEMPLNRILYEMELKGIMLSKDQLNELKVQFDSKYESLLKELQITTKDYTANCKSTCPKKVHEHKFNPSSPMQVKGYLQSKGVLVNKTDRPTLSEIVGGPCIEFIDNLLEFKKVAKVKTTYVDAFLENPTFPWLHTTFNQVSYNENEDSGAGIRTGRLSSSNPNLQNIPSQKDENDVDDIGAKIRNCFVASPGNLLIVGDYSQIEYRLLGHFTKEPMILEAYHNGRDIHEETGKVLGVGRKLGKTLNFAAIYGAYETKIAKTAGITKEEAKAFLDAYWQKLPKVAAWVRFIKTQAKINKGVRTLAGRWIALPGITEQGALQQAKDKLYSLNKLKEKRGEKIWRLESLAKSIMYHNERVAVNATIQGSAADIIRIAMIRLKESGIVPNLQVHDELVFDIPAKNVAIMEQIKLVMETVVKLSVPLEVSIKSGYTWQECK